MALQNFVNNSYPTIAAPWLNQVDIFVNVLFNGATSASAARTAITAAASGTNSDITALTALNAPLPLSGNAGTAGQVLTSAGSSSPAIWSTPSGGTVTSFSLITANGFSGSVANASTTPALTLSTSVSGILYGNSGTLTPVTIGGGLAFFDGVLSNTSTAVNQFAYENNATFTTNYTMTTGNNGVTAGPITINAGVTVQIPSGSAWVIV